MRGGARIFMNVTGRTAAYAWPASGTRLERLAALLLLIPVLVIICALAAILLVVLLVVTASLAVALLLTAFFVKWRLTRGGARHEVAEAGRVIDGDARRLPDVDV